MHTTDALTARQELVKAARCMMNGTISYIEGSCLISSLRWSVGIADLDPDTRILMAIASETDAFPVGEDGRHWQSEALSKLQPDIARAEEWARKAGLDACQKLIDRFG